MLDSNTRIQSGVFFRNERHLLQQAFALTFLKATLAVVDHSCFHFFSLVLRASVAQVGKEALESSYAVLQTAAKPSQLQARRFQVGVKQKKARCPRDTEPFERASK